jgi:hypothetical protein
MDRKSKLSGSLKWLHVFDSREISGAPGETRTPDPLLRRQTLFPTELRARCWCDCKAFLTCTTTDFGEFVGYVKVVTQSITDAIRLELADVYLRGAAYSERCLRLETFG